jgi:hypothetical protein
VCVRDDEQRGQKTTATRRRQSWSSRSSPRESRVKVQTIEWRGDNTEEIALQNPMHVYLIPPLYLRRFTKSSNFSTFKYFHFKSKSSKDTVTRIQGLLPLNFAIEQKEQTLNLFDRYIRVFFNSVVLSLKANTI